MVAFSKNSAIIVLTILFLCVSFVEVQSANTNYIVSTKVADINKEEPDVYPMVDLAKLQKSIVYPAIAKNSRIEGTVIVRAFVSKKGKVLKTMVDKSDNKVLTSSAVSAVKKTQFTPATKNGKAVNCWVSLPISFKL